jgi:hypothetical protein
MLDYYLQYKNSKQRTPYRRTALVIYLIYRRIGIDRIGLAQLVYYLTCSFTCTLDYMASGEKSVGFSHPLCDLCEYLNRCAGLS